jgi:hypothetical protein
MNLVIQVGGFLREFSHCVGSAYERLKRRCQPLTEDKESLQQYYFDSATHYYLLARYAVFARAVPTAGILFHHALERYFKGYLVLNLNELQRIQLGHSLKRTWKLYKRTTADPALAKHDKSVRAIDKFEDIRYPEKSTRLGAQIYFSLGHPLPGEGPTTNHPPVYTIFVTEIDELVEAVFTKAGLNPKFFIRGLSNHGLTYLKQDNLCTKW